MGNSAQDFSSLKSSYKNLQGVLIELYLDQQDCVTALNTDPGFVGEACKFYVTNGDYFSAKVRLGYDQLLDNLFTYFENLNIRDPVVISDNPRTVLKGGSSIYYLEFNGYNDILSKCKDALKEQYDEVIILADLTIKKGLIEDSKAEYEDELRNKMQEGMRLLKKIMKSEDPKKKKK